MVPDAPFTIDLSAGGSGPWPGFVLSGVTGMHAASLNGSYELAPYNGDWLFSGPGGAEVLGTGGGAWSITNGTSRFTGTGTWPWAVTTWATVNGGAGAPAFVRKLAAPSSLDLGGDAAGVAATLATELTGSNNDLVFTSRLAGRLGNDVTVRYVSPGTINASLAVSVSGRDITVHLATNGSAAITSTATQVRTAIGASAGAAPLVTVANKAANDGTGVVTAMAATALGGGAGGLPLPPVTLAL